MAIPDPPQGGSLGCPAADATGLRTPFGGCQRALRGAESWFWRAFVSRLWEVRWGLLLAGKGRFWFALAMPR